RGGCCLAASRRVVAAGGCGCVDGATGYVGAARASASSCRRGHRGGVGCWLLLLVRGLLSVKIVPPAHLAAHSRRFDLCAPACRDVGVEHARPCLSNHRASSKGRGCSTPTADRADQTLESAQNST